MTVGNEVDITGQQFMAIHAFLDRTPDARWNPVPLRELQGGALELRTGLTTVLVVERDGTHFEQEAPL